VRVAEFWDLVGQRWQRAVDAVDDVPDGKVVTEELRKRDRRVLSGTIAVTGYRGAGKTVLRDGLLNRIGQSYVPPPKSLTDELHRFALRRGQDERRLGLVVVPGQVSRDRRDSLARLFDARRGIAPSGVIHVVCWGHNTIDTPQVRRTNRTELEADGHAFNLESLRFWNRQAELEEFREVSRSFGAVWGRQATPWLIIAVAQTHLYWGSVQDAAHYYLPGWPNPRPPTERPERPEIESEFRQDFRGLVEDMRALAPARVAVLPLASYPNDYRFDNVQVRSDLSPGASRNLMGAFAATLGEFCELGS
jgi:hypothetical protein